MTSISISKGRIAGFEHHLDIHLISTLKEKKKKNLQKTIFKTHKTSEMLSFFLVFHFVCVIIDRIEKEFFYEIEDFADVSLIKSY